MVKALRRTPDPVPDLEPMEARLEDDLPRGAGWQFEPKWDGFRCLASIRNKKVELRAKSGKPLGRYFPEIVAALTDLPCRGAVLDGELIIRAAGGYAFDRLQMRLHPAQSRIRKLSAETPATFMLFDCLETEDEARLFESPLHMRRAALEAFYRAGPPDDRIRLSPATERRATARAWLAKAGPEWDGVIAKRLDAPYLFGERAMIKVKRMRSADCVVGGFRYAAGAREVGSLLLGLYDEQGRLNHVGFTSTLPRAGRADLTRRLEALVEPPGFTGTAPGAPSRWRTDRSSDRQPLRPKLVVEVRYDHADARRFRHGAKLLRWRPDKSPSQCRMQQLESGRKASR